MYEEYSLPPGYRYELQPHDSGNYWFGIVDRAGENVLAVPLTDVGWYEAACALWRVVDTSPEMLGPHTAAFLTWQLNRSPLEHLDQ